MTWYVLYSAPLAETAAAKSLERHGFEAYVPTRREERRHRRTRQVRTVNLVLFPRYIFLRDQDSVDWHAVCDSPGVIAPILANGRPASLGDAIVDELREAQQNGLFDTVFPTGRELTKGRRVRIIAGAFAGQTAQVASVLPGRSAKVLLRMFGTTRCATVGLDAIKLVA